MSSFSAKQIIDKAFFVSNIIGVGSFQAADGSEADDALNTLNFILSGWQIGNLMNYSTHVEQYSATVESFTVGPTGADLTAQRPPAIMDAYTRINGGSGQPLDLLMIQLSAPEYDAIQLKTMTSTIPTHFYYEPTAPNGTMHIWPKPPGGEPSVIRFRYQDLIGQYATLNSTLELPPGYDQALIYVLADHLAGQYGSPNSWLASKAQQAVDVIQRANVRPNPLQYDQDAPGQSYGQYDTRTGLWY